MVDLETLSTSMDAQILTIGAVAFNFWGKVTDEFYRRVDVTSCEELGLRKSDETVKFWEGQHEDARKEAFDPENRQSIRKVIEEFNQFWVKNKGERFWCLGANFDEPILSTVYERLSIQKPWKFWNVRCLRTYLGVVGLSMSSFGTVAHHALADCKNQILAYNQANLILSKYK